MAQPVSTSSQVPSNKNSATTVSELTWTVAIAPAGTGSVKKMSGPGIASDERARVEVMLARGEALTEARRFEESAAEFHGAREFDAVNLPVIHARRLHSMKSIRPWGRVHISKTIAHFCFFGV